MTLETRKISVFELGLGLFSVAGSWLLFWLPGYTPILLVSILVAGLFLLLCLFVLSILKPNWSVPTSQSKRLVFWGIVMVSALLAPLILYWSVVQATEHVLKETDIDAQRISYKVRLIDNLQFGESPSRRIHAIYQLTEPIDNAAEKLEEWANSKNPPWQISQSENMIRTDGVKGKISVICDPGSPDTGGGIHYITIWQDGTMTMMIRFADAPHKCGLP
ncbi:hypothetical protein KC887_07555 [Candidatus Kaiserbacteria bacterium]|nr:hypothetical protein [Candidatus Kaiserbacteria bacterium]